MSKVIQSDENGSLWDKYRHILEEWENSEDPKKRVFARTVREFEESEGYQ